MMSRMFSLLRNRSSLIRDRFKEFRRSPHIKSGRLSVPALGFFVVIVAVVAGAFVILRNKVHEADSIELAQAEGAAKTMEAKASPELPAGWSITGGVVRPSTDVKAAKSSRNGEAIAAVKSLKKPEGGFPLVSPDLNTQTKQLSAALNDGTRPELTSSFVIKRDFDLARFRESGKEYAERIASEAQPGRVFAPAQPDDGVEPLRFGSSKMHRVVQGESVTLKVKATSFAPVSFTSFNGGQFENSLSNITVVADEAGLAQATFATTSGTKNSVQVMAASPVNSEQLVFTVDVKLARQ